MLDPRALRRFLRNRGALAGSGIVLLLVLFSLFGPLLSSHGPLESDFVAAAAGNGPPPPGPDFFFGADRLFRDVFVRLAYGGRLSLAIAVSSTFLACSIGALVGIMAGYSEGARGFAVPWSVLLGMVALFVSIVGGHPWWGVCVVVVSFALVCVGHGAGARMLTTGPRVDLDTALMRFVDVGLSFPFLLLVLAVGAALDRTNAGTILLTLGFTGWLGAARLVRAKTLEVRAADYVLASRALGQRTSLILIRHVLPNVVGPLLVIATISVAQMIVAESVLSYLGAGVSPPEPTWGHMLYEGQEFYQAAPWMLVAPAAAILLAVFGFNLLGEGLRDALDPKSR